MSRRERNFQEERETKRMIYIAASILIVAILAFIITFLVYSNAFSSEPQVGEVKTNPITDLATNEQGTQQASSSIGKSVNEMENTTTKVAINTSNMVKEPVEQNTQPKENEQTQVETKQPEPQIQEQEPQKQETPKEKEKEEVKDPTFIKPVEGEITKGYAKENLVYSETLREWVTHSAIDIKAEKATIVKVAADGTVKSIKNDPRYGITVVVEHVNGFQTVYANLLTAEFVKEGEKLTSGQTVGTVGNTATFEIVEEPHLHFEILKDGEQLDPTLYVK